MPTVEQAIKALEDWHDAYDHCVDELGLDEAEAVRRADEYVRLGPDRRVNLSALNDILSDYYLPPPPPLPPATLAQQTGYR